METASNLSSEENNKSEREENLILSGEDKNLEVGQSSSDTEESRKRANDFNEDDDFSPNENNVGNRPPKKSCIFKVNDATNAASAISRVETSIDLHRKAVQPAGFLPIAAAEAQVLSMFSMVPLMNSTSSRMNPMGMQMGMGMPMGMKMPMSMPLGMPMSMPMMHHPHPIHPDLSMSHSMQNYRRLQDNSSGAYNQRMPFNMVNFPKPTGPPQIRKVTLSWTKLLVDFRREFDAVFCTSCKNKKAHLDCAGFTHNGMKRRGIDGAREKWFPLLLLDSLANRACRRRMSAVSFGRRAFNQHSVLIDLMTKELGMNLGPDPFNPNIVVHLNVEIEEPWNSFATIYDVLKGEAPPKSSKKYMDALMHLCNQPEVGSKRFLHDSSGVINLNSLIMFCFKDILIQVVPVIELSNVEEYLPNIHLDDYLDFEFSDHVRLQQIRGTSYPKEDENILMEPISGQHFVHPDAPVAPQYKASGTKTSSSSPSSHDSENSSRSKDNQEVNRRRKGLHNAILELMTNNILMKHPDKKDLYLCKIDDSVRFAEWCTDGCIVGVGPGGVCRPREKSLIFASSRSQKVILSGSPLLPPTIAPAAAGYIFISLAFFAMQ